jgi:hypothetical protein
LCTGFTGFTGVVGSEPPLAAGEGAAAATPPVSVAKAGVVATARAVKLDRIALRVRTRKTVPLSSACGVS